jgi:hypothetical protein
MAQDNSPDKIIFGIGDGRARSMVRLADGSYADRIAISAGAGLVTDSSGEFTFDLSSLASRFKYDSDNNQTQATYGPDQMGRYVTQNSTWENNLLVAESAWVLTDSDGNEV